MASTDPTVFVLKRTPHTHTNALTKQKEFETYVQPDKKIIGYFQRSKRFFFGGVFFFEEKVLQIKSEDSENPFGTNFNFLLLSPYMLHPGCVHIHCTLYVYYVTSSCSRSN